MPIKLEDFVAESLIQIVNGVKKAQASVVGTGARISPLMRSTTSKESVGSAEGAGGQPVYDVGFDVAVVASEEKATSGGVGVVVGVFALGSRGQSSEGGGQTSRIQFRVPLLLPSQHPEPRSSSE